MSWRTKLPSFVKGLPLVAVSRFAVRSAFTLNELLVVIVVITVLLSGLIPAVNAAREAARRCQCQQHLRSWGQAFNAYVAAHRRYPPAATWRVGGDAQRPPQLARHSMFSFLLPFFDQQRLSQSIDYRQDWNCSRNIAWSKQELGGILICPSAPGNRRGKHATDYTTAIRVDPAEAAIGRLVSTGVVRNRSRAGPPSWGAGQPVWEGILALETVDHRRHLIDRRVSRPEDVDDGLSKTVLLVENAGKPICYRHGRRANCHITRFRWASPTIWMAINDVCGLSQLVNCHNNSQPYAFHRGGLQLLIADGSVRWVTTSVAADVFVAAITRAAGD